MKDKVYLQTCKQNNKRLCCVWAQLDFLCCHVVHFVVSLVHLFFIAKQKQAVDNLHTINSTNDLLAGVIQFFFTLQKNWKKKLKTKKKCKKNFRDKLYYVSKKKGTMRKAKTVFRAMTSKLMFITTPLCVVVTKKWFFQILSLLLCNFYELIYWRVQTE